MMSNDLSRRGRHAAVDVVAYRSRRVQRHATFEPVTVAVARWWVRCAEEARGIREKAALNSPSMPRGSSCTSRHADQPAVDAERWTDLTFAATASTASAGAGVRLVTARVAGPRRWSDS